MKKFILLISFLFCKLLYCQDNNLPEYKFLVDKAIVLTQKQFEKVAEEKNYIDSLTIINEANQSINETNSKNLLDKKNLNKKRVKNKKLYFWRVTTLHIDKKYVVIINAITVYFRKKETYINKTGGVSMSIFIPNANSEWELNSFDMIDL
jgi:hypothetical protein